MKSPALLSVTLLLFLCLSARADDLVSEEVYYNEDMSKTAGTKKYFYNDKNNIISTATQNDNNTGSRTEYIYRDGLLVSGEEYDGDTSRVKYFIFDNDDKRRAVRKTEYDMNENVIMAREYVYDKNGNLASIKDIGPEGKYLGERKFFYADGRLTEEKITDDKNNVLLKKKITYKEGKIYLIEFYSADDKKLRVIKRYYSRLKGDNSKLGLRDNFYDIR